MSKLQLKLDPSYTLQMAYTDIHKLILQAKQAHYVTKSYAAHGALGGAYDSVIALADDITEQLIGYSDTDPQPFQIGSIVIMNPRTMGILIIGIAERLESLADSKGYSNVCNLSQELSGVGAKLKYLSRFP